jgi:hypothetical protein
MVGKWMPFQIQQEYCAPREMAQFRNHVGYFAVGEMV